MGLYSKIKGKVAALRQVWNSSDGNRITMSQIMELFSSSRSAELGSDIGEIVFFTCLKVLSESIGKIPCYLVDSDKRRISDHDATWFLTVQPNDFMTPAQFFTHLEFNRNYYGNAYVYISKDAAGKIDGLYPLDPRRVQIFINSTEQFPARQFWYFYTDGRTGKSYYLAPEDILHFKSWITDESGLSGKSVREILATSFAGAKASTKFLNELYEKGLTARAVVKYTGDLKRESQNAMLDAIIEQSQDKGRQLISLPIGFDLQPLDLKLTDSQFFELKKYSALQVAAAFGVEPIHLNDFEKASYANSSLQNLLFYVNTLLYIISSYEQELNRKLLTRQELVSGMGFKFNVAVILRGDISQQADIIQKMVASGVYSPNDARRWLDQPPIDGDAGNQYLVNGSMVPLESAGAAYRQNTGGDNNADNQEQG